MLFVVHTLQQAIRDALGSGPVSSIPTNIRQVAAAARKLKTDRIIIRLGEKISNSWSRHKL